MRDEGTSGFRLSATQVRHERLAIALQMLQLSLRDGAGWPVSAQETLRRAVVEVQRLHAWSKAHAS